MLARRIIAVSPEKAFAKRLAVALKATGGAVDTYGSPDDLAGEDLAAALVVIHQSGELAGAAMRLVERLAGDAKVIVILPRSDLAAVVEIMQASERVAGMMAAEDLDTHTLSAMATRVLAGDLFGLEKLVPWGTQVHSALVGDYQEKLLCITQLSQFAEHMGVRRKYREAIEQVLDEMLMNALYDAPVDEHGKPIFAEISTQTRISLRVEQKAVVQYACDGTQFVVGVRDAFGRLERATVLRYLHKCLHSEQQIDRKAGGAGLGLYLITSSSTEVYFNVIPGVATEAVCTFNLEAPKLQLESFGFFTGEADAAELPADPQPDPQPAGAPPPAEPRAKTSPAAAAPPRAPTYPMAPAPPRALIGVLLAAIAVTVGLVGVMAWPRLFGARAQVTIQTIPPGAAIDVDGKSAGTTAGGALVVRDLERGRAYPIVARLEGYEPKQAVVQPRADDAEAAVLTLELVALAPTVVLESTPPGAQVTVDGKPAGTTPLTLTTLPPGRPAQLVFTKAGYQDAPVRIDVPRGGKELRLIQPLAASQELARVRLVSTPPGAQVVQNGQLMPGLTTPAEVLVEDGKPVRFMLTMPRRVPLLIEAFTPTRGADDVVRGGKLVEGAPLRVTAAAEGKLAVANAPHCQDLALPAECVIAPGHYAIEVTLTQGPRITKTIRVGSRGTEVNLELGYIDAGPQRMVMLPGGGVRRAAFEPGPRRVTISDGATTKVVVVNVRANTTVAAP
ncbi:MAG TPA: PEGA domain-containing protein [Kofleriaceae bacterium]|nr:PEGA domain-containing protein [Kofleriaceae bacterium]